MIKRSIIRKSVLSVIILFLIIFLGTSIVTGYQLYKANMDRYEDMAYAFVMQASANIDAVSVEQILEEKDDFLAYWKAEDQEEQPERDRPADVEPDPRAFEEQVDHLAAVYQHQDRDDDRQQHQGHGKHRAEALSPVPVAGRAPLRQREIHDAGQRELRAGSRP